MNAAMRCFVDKFLSRRPTAPYNTDNMQLPETVPRYACNV